MLIEAATLEEAQDKYSWYTFDGQTKKKLSHKSHIEQLTKGDQYGLRHKRGSGYYLILPHMYHVNFILSEREGAALLKRSKIKRKSPKLEKLTTSKGKRIRIDSKKENFHVWDHPRFRPQKSVKQEAKTGIKFSNYQWIKLTDNNFKVFKANGKAVLAAWVKGQVLGVRFIKPAVGGIVVTAEGSRHSITAAQYDDLFTKSKLLPKSRWPEGGISAKDIAANAEYDKIKEKQERASARALLREEEKAKKIKERLDRRAANRKRKEEERKERKRLADKLAGEKIKQAEIKLKPVKREDPEKLAEKLRKKGPMDEDVKVADDLFEDDDLQDVDIDLDKLDTIYDDDTDVSKVEFDPEPSKELSNKFDDLIGKARKEARIVSLDDFDDEGDEDEDEDEDLDDDVEYDSEEDEEGGDEDLEDAEDEDEDAEDEDEDLDDDVEYDSEEDAEDLEEEPQEDEGDGEEGSDAKEEFEESDVIQFEGDSEDREFVILDIVPMAASPDVLVYKLYDTSNEPDVTHSVRINTRQRGRISDIAKKTDTMRPKDYAKLLVRTENLDRSKDRITK